MSGSKRSWLCPFLSFALAGCTSYSTFQTARVLPSDTARYNVGVGYFSAASLPYADLYGISPRFASWWIELGARWGVGSDVDIGARAAIPRPYTLINGSNSSFTAFGPIHMDGKIQLLTARNLAGSVGLGLSFVYLRANGSSAFDADLFLPMFLSYDFNPYFTVYGGMRVVISAARGDSIHKTSSFLGSSFGVRIGWTAGVFLEVARVATLQLPLDGAVAFYGISFFFGSGRDLSEFKTNRRAETWHIDRTEKGPPRVRARLPPPKGSRAVKITPDDHVALLTQADNRAWGLGERVCLERAGVRVVCGNIIKSDVTGAALKYENPRGTVQVGMLATEEHPSSSENERSTEANPGLRNAAP